MNGTALPVAALQAALAAEHAAVWAYDLASAFVTGSAASQLREAANTHQARRDATQRLLVDAGVQPVPPEPGYLTPEPVTDMASAVRLAITAETDVASGWRSVLERSAPDPTLRGMALDALVDSAVRAARWRASAGITPVTVPFPGTG